MENLSQDLHCPGQDTNHVPHEHKSGYYSTVWGDSRLICG
jgi:hypothetical protein